MILIRQKNYLNREIRVKEVLSGNYSIEINGSAKNI